MAEKFGLLFSDIKGNRKVLMIEDSTYTGAIKPLIGTKEPVEIDYDTDDDIHDSPIMGSRMEINLWVTDTRTNLVPNSADFTQWTSGNIATANREDPPFDHINGRNLLTSGDTEEADSLQYAGGSTGVTQDVTLQPNTTYTASVYVKKFSTGAQASVGITTTQTGDMQNVFTFDTKATSISAAADGGGYEDLGGGWYRIYVQGTTGASVTNAKMKVNNAFTAALYWGAQLEEGTSPTQYIHTTSTTNDTEYDVFYEQNDRTYLAKLYYEESGSFKEYWRGFITKDVYKEAIVTKPYDIKVNATDGLGELGGAIFTPEEINYQTESYDSLAETLAAALSKTGHSLEIHALLDLQYKASGILRNVLEQDNRNINKKDWLVFTPKEYVKELLRSLNAKIFQGHGKWYVISNSAYYDTRVQNQSYTTANGGGTPTGIGDDLNDYLVNSGNEHLKFNVFTTAGAVASPSTNQENDLLLQIPSDLTPLNKDLIRDYLPGIKTAEYTIDLESFNSSRRFSVILGRDQEGKYLNVDGSFESTSVGTISLYNWTEIIQDEYAVQGQNVWLSSGSNSYVTSSTSLVQQYSTSTLVGTTPFKDTIDFSFRLRPITTATSINARWELRRQNTQSAPVTQYWNDITQTFQSVVFRNTTNLEKDRWNKISVTIPKSTINTATDNLVFILYKSYVIGSNLSEVKLYMDHVQFKKNGDLFEGDQFERRQANQTDKYAIESKMYLLYGQRSRDMQPSIENENFLGKSITQMILNDRRDYLGIYEGTFYNNNAAPVSPRNKIWLNFGSAVLQERFSAIIKKMKYSVKSNQIKMRFYLPNPDDDQTNDLKIRKDV